MCVIAWIFASVLPQATVAYEARLEYNANAIKQSMELQTMLGMLRGTFTQITGPFKQEQGAEYPSES